MNLDWFSFIGEFLQRKSPAGHVASTGVLLGDSSISTQQALSSNLGVLLELHVTDFTKSEKFYNLLGFEKVWQRDPEEFKGYLVMKKDNQVLCFWGGNEEIYRHRDPKYKIK